MEWIERLNEALSYLEGQLKEEIDLDKAAQIACCSTYHFQRMFGYMAGMSLSEYVRRRRMSLAAVDLQAPEAKIVDVALQYGYASPTAFNRAFQAVHGHPPSRIKEGGVLLKSQQPIRFTITVKGVEEMNYRIEKKDAFQIVGIAQPLCKDMERNFEEVPKLWQKAAMDGSIPRLLSLMDGKPEGILGVSACYEQENWTYFIAVSSSREGDDSLTAYTVPACTWAIFTGEGECPKAIQELELRIISEWLPSSGYEYDNGPDVEVYLNDDPQKAKFEVWIPVKRAKV